MDDNNEENKNNDLIEENEYIEEHKTRKSIKIIALITAICLVLMIIAPIVTKFNLPSLNFLKESFQLIQKSQVKEFQKSIVTITGDGKKGTGFNIREEGLIVTNAHVVKNMKNIMISFYGGDTFKGEVLQLYADIDLALIKIEGEDLPKLELGQNVEGKTEEEILIIGNPLGYVGVANKGIVQGLAKVKGIEKPILLIEAPVNKGNSGSPVINKEGKVIGIIFATINNQKAGDKELGAAIPIEYLNEKRE